MPLTPLALALSLAVAAPSTSPAAPPAGSGPARRAARAAPTAAEARAFVAEVNAELERLQIRAQTAAWVHATNITEDTERLAAWANEASLAYLSQAVERAKRFRRVSGLDPATARSLQLLRLASANPAPRDPALRAELSALLTRLESRYGAGRWCGPDGQGPCRDIEQLSEVLAKSDDWDALLDAWKGWHQVGAPLRADYARMVQLANAGAREAGFADMGDLWRSAYDMPPAEVAREADRLWAQLAPLYRDLHCYVRGKLQERWGRERVPDGRPIPAHLLGNLWAQEWGHLLGRVAPPGSADGLDVEGALVGKGFDPERMMRVGEGFYTSLGLDPLPGTFWRRSLFTKPRDREVVCHASAWTVEHDDDLRVKMCTRVNGEDLLTIHHELGHLYYDHAYRGLPTLFQQGANDGFHEAIGDTIALSVTPAYLARVGVLDRAPAEDERAVIGAQLREALERVAFLPFGLLVDRWRWAVFSGQVPPSRYNGAWWDLRRELQGVDAPVTRSEADFDPGAKYHVAANVPYLRYFMSFVYQFQFHQALCAAAGHRGPLHTCSIHGSHEAGRRLQAVLSMGASRPWPEAMEAITGQRRADASALLEYFAPLRGWLVDQNRGRTCGW